MKCNPCFLEVGDQMKICPFAFSKLYLGVDHYVPCCHAWMKQEYFDELDHSGDPWTSQAAITLREGMLKGDYKYCDRQKCQQPLIDITHLESLETSEAFIDKNSLENIKQRKNLDKINITSVVFGVDERCNLECASCRKQKITKASKRVKNNIFNTLFKFKKILPHLRFIDFAGYSEFFFLDWTKDLLNKINPKTAPNLQAINILTNGTLLNQKMYDSLGPGKDFFNTINISIDAGNSETYQKVRGADWNSLKRNLEFISDLRRSGKFNHFIINFTIQKNNLTSVEDFINLGEDLDVDEILFTGLYDWSSVMKLDYKENAIHLPTHSSYANYLALKNKFSDHPKVKWLVETYD